MATMGLNIMLIVAYHVLFARDRHARQLRTARAPTDFGNGSFDAMALLACACVI
jgi:hypothetical protein